MVDQVAVAPLRGLELVRPLAQGRIELGIAGGDRRLAGELFDQRDVALVDRPRLAVGDGERAEHVAAGPHQRRNDDRAKLEPVWRVVVRVVWPARIRAVVGSPDSLARQLPRGR